MKRFVSLLVIVLYVLGVVGQKAESHLSDLDLAAQGDQYVQEEQYEQAFNCYLKAALHGYAPAENQIGLFYTLGIYKKKNLDDAINWFKRAAEKNDSQAQVNLGTIYLGEFDIDKRNDSLALYYLHKAAEQNNCTGMYLIGRYYYKTNTYDKAYSWFLKSAEYNFIPAQRDLGILFRDGYGKNSKQNALEWFTKAAIQGEPFSQNEVGFIYENDGNYEEAINWYSKAAEQDNNLAQYNLGNIFFNIANNHCIEKKEKEELYEKAAYWLEKSANQGYAAAQNQLGLLYMNGLGVPQKYSRAMELFDLAIKGNDTNALNNKGKIYLKDKKYEDALSWFNRAAEKGVATALFNIGVMYENGFGVEKDLDSALVWYQRAVDKGYSEGQNFLDNIKNTLLTKKSEQLRSLDVIVPSTPGKRIALIIGNDDYSWGRLTNPCNDVIAMATKLKELGFDIFPEFVKTNLNRDEMEKVITDFSEKAKGYDVALFYYSGHAIQNSSGENRLLPVRETFPFNKVKDSNSISLNDIFDEMEMADVKRKIVILDACRNNFGSKGFTQELQNINKAKGFFIGYATQTGEEAIDGASEGFTNSPYTKVLLEMLDLPNVSINQIFEEVTKKVEKLTNGVQSPRYMNDWSGAYRDFIFNIQH